MVQVAGNLNDGWIIGGNGGVDCCSGVDNGDFGDCGRGEENGGSGECGGGEESGCASGGR